MFRQSEDRNGLCWSLGAMAEGGCWCTLVCLVVVVASLWGAAAPPPPAPPQLTALGVGCMGLPALGVAYLLVL